MKFTKFFILIIILAGILNCSRKHNHCMQTSNLIKLKSPNYFNSKNNQTKTTNDLHNNKNLKDFAIYPNKFLNFKSIGIIGCCLLVIFIIILDTPNLSKVISYNLNSFEFDYKFKSMNSTDDYIKCNEFDNIYLSKYIDNNFAAIYNERMVYCPIPGNKNKEIKYILKKDQYKQIDKLNPQNITQIMYNNYLNKIVFIQDPLERILMSILKESELSDCNNSSQLIKKWTKEILSLENTGLNNLNKYLWPQFFYCDLYKWKNRFTIYNLADKQSLKKFHNNIKKIVVDRTLLYNNAINFFNVRHLSILIGFYDNDYKLFNISLPEWICDIVIKEWKQKIYYTEDELNKLNDNKPSIDEKHILANTFHTDLLNLWNNIISLNSRSLSCKSKIENCIFNGNCILNEPTKNINNKSIKQSNAFDKTFIDNSFPKDKWEKQKTFGGLYLDSSGVYLKNINLYFCIIPKNSLTLWLRVFLRILNLNDSSIVWWSKDDSIFKLLGQNINFKPNLLFTPNEITSIMQDDKQFKAVFTRDPLHRALSGVLDKMKYYFNNTDNAKTLIEYWLKYIYDINSYGINNLNQHIVPQYYYCDIYKWWDKYHHYNFENTSHRKQFLFDINLWEEVGIDGWSKIQHAHKKKNKWKKFKNGIKYSLEDFFIAPNMPNHVTHSSQFLLSYFNVRYLSILIEFYGLDYRIFNRKFPEWICDIINNEWNKLNNDNILIANGFLIDLLNLYNIINNFDKSLNPSCFYKLEKCLLYGNC